MTRVGVRSDALDAAATRVEAGAEDLRLEASAVAVAVARCRSPGLPRGLGALAAWVRVEAEAVHLVGPGGLWGQGLALDALALRLRAAARAYEEVERAAGSVLAAVRAGAGEAASWGWLDEVGSVPVVRSVAPTRRPGPFGGPADLVVLGGGLGGGRVRVVEVEAPGGGSAWVVAVPGTQAWSPRAAANPFDLTSDVRALTGEATLAAAGVTAALDRAMAAAGRTGQADPVLLVGHSQGGIHAAALATDPAFTAAHRVTHVVTTGAPVGAFPVPGSIRVLSVEHADDPVPTLDLTPNPGGLVLADPAGR